MERKYQHAGIAGKFRMLHLAHRELILHAMSQTDHLHIFIVDLPEQKRYSTIEGLIASFERIFEKLTFFDYTIHIIHEDLSGVKWDEKILELAPTLEVMFDSKEVYGNALVKNEFIELTISKDVSVSAIEQRPYSRYESSLIAPEFWPNMVKCVGISGANATGKTLLAKKLAFLFDGVYCTNTEKVANDSMEKKLLVIDDFEIGTSQIDGIILLGDEKVNEISNIPPVINIKTLDQKEQFLEAITFVSSILK